MGRRIAKVHPDGNEIQYLWDGSRLLQEYHKDRTYTYVYTEDRNYEPLAQITTYNGSDKAREILYYHNDQIGIPREMTDEEGNIVWSGDYSGWGKLTQEGRLKLDIHQPFRLQNQHYDEETGLHYNFFRYYDPEIGRFTQQDPIGLLGGLNLYAFGFNIQEWFDHLGLACQPVTSKGVPTAAGYAVGQSGNAISAAGGITQTVKHAPGTARITGGWGTVSRFFGTIFGLETALADPVIAESGVNATFHIEVTKCHNIGKCSEDQYLTLKKMYNDCPRDAWAELNRIKGKK